MHYRKYIAAITLLVMVTACNKQFIDIAPESSLGVNGFYKTQNDIDQAVLAGYASLQGLNEYGQNFVYFMEIRSDNSTVSDFSRQGARYGDIDRCIETPSNAVLDPTWAACYAGIQRCNIVLNRIDGISMDANTKAVRKGEVKFIRALTYFNLVRIWGNVPLVLNEVVNPNDEFTHSRDTVTKVYAQIIADLKDAIQVLPKAGQTDVGRATLGAAQLLLAKVYLTTNDYADCITQAEAVIADSVTYQLLPAYADIFNVSKKNGKESVFEIQYTKGGIGQGSDFANLFAPAGATSLVGNVGETIGDNLPTTYLYNSYETGDIRRDATIGTINGKMYTKKYLDIPFADGDAGNDFIVLRYADAWLMAAEAYNEQWYTTTGKAFTYINRIRQRAALAPFTATTVPDQPTFRLAIEKERQHEFAFENHRWFDLLRTGRALTVMNATSVNGVALNIQQCRLLFPIPQTEIDASPAFIIQNNICH